MGEQFKLDPKVIEGFIRDSFELPDELPEMVQMRYVELERYTNRVAHAIYIAALRAIQKDNRDNMNKLNMN